MWSVDTPGSGRRHAERGFTMIEALLVTFLVAMMSVALNQAIQATNSADQQLETLTRAARQGQRLCNEISEFVASSRHIYDTGAVSSSYMAACDLSRFPMAPDARMPAIDIEGDLNVDGAGTSHTGNVLLLLRETAGSPCVADADTGKFLTIDTYRLTLIYPHVGDRVLMAGEAPSRDVVIWQSMAFPSLQQILAISDEAERESVIVDLFERYGYQYAWEPHASLELAFYALNDKGEVEESPAGPIAIAEDPVLTNVPRLGLADAQLAATNPQVSATRAVLTGNELGGWVPHGLEIKISGSSKARKVWVHTVIEAARQSGRNRAVQVCSTIVDARDF